MRYAIIKNGIVDNVIDADAAFIATHYPGAVPSIEAGPGDTYSAGQFVRPAPAPRQVPKEVSKAQIVLALEAAGIDETEVDAVIAALPAGQAKKEVRLRWKHSSTVRRASPIVTLLAQAKGLSDTTLDDIFRNAETL